MRVTLTLAIGSGLAIGALFCQWADPQLAQSQESKATAGAALGELKSIEASAAAFEMAFNKGDAKAIAAQFSENAEIVDANGDVVQGRDKIEARFANLFKTYPKAKVSVELTSLRQLSPDVAVEDGFSATTFEPATPGTRSPYTLVHLRRNGKWLIASVRDFPEEETPMTAHEQLKSLEWLVGDWVDQTPDAKVETSCHWDSDGNFLVQSYVVKLRGGNEGRGTQRIGWDPHRKTIRAWAFDHSGGFGESTWTQVNGEWVIKAIGVTPDGKAASVTRVLTPLGADLFDLASRERLVGDELLPDVTVRVARKPPSPATP